MSKLQFKSNQVRVVDSANGMENAWKKSKPTYGYDDTPEGREKLRIDLNGLMSNDLPICGFNIFSFEATTSLLVRDLIFSVRPINPWASSNRIEKRTWENAFIEMCYKGSNYLNRIELDLGKVIEDEESGIALDLAKRRLPNSMMTTYNFTMDFRSLMCFLKTLDYCDKSGFNNLIGCFLRSIEFTIIQYETSDFKNKFEFQFSDQEKLDWLFDYFYKHPSNSIFDRLSIPQQLLDAKGDYIDNNISYLTTDELNQTFSLVVNVATALGAQFVRQHYSKIRNGYFNRIKKDGYLKTVSTNQSDEEFYSSTGDLAALNQLISRRTCWVAQIDWTDKFGWSGIIGGLVDKMNYKEFKETLPCHGSCHHCTIKDETKLRLHTKTRQGATDGHVPDENPLCPILVENPNHMQERINFYKSDANSPIIKRWVDLAKHIVPNPNNKGTLVYNGKLDVALYDNEEVTQYLGEESRSIAIDPNKNLLDEFYNYLD